MVSQATRTSPPSLIFTCMTWAPGVFAKAHYASMYFAYVQFQPPVDTLELVNEVDCISCLMLFHGLVEYLI